MLLNEFNVNTDGGDTVNVLNTFHGDTAMTIIEINGKDKWMGIIPMKEKYSGFMSATNSSITALFKVIALKIALTPEDCFLLDELFQIMYLQKVQKPESLETKP